MQRFFNPVVPATAPVASLADYSDLLGESMTADISPEPTRQVIFIQNPDTTSRVNPCDRIDEHGRFIDPEQQLDSRSEGIAEHDWQ